MKHWLSRMSAISEVLFQFAWLACVTADEPFVFRDVTVERGILPAASGIRGHGAGWGDVDGDGWIDLYIATFHNEGSQPNLFFRNQQGKFALDTQEALRISTRGT